jgi:hypothetical protein
MPSFKTEDIRHQWDDIRLSFKLKTIVGMVEVCFNKWLSKACVITSIYRPDDKGVHGHWRGVDVRTRNILKREAKEIEKYINYVWIYDPERPELNVALFHDSGLGEHLHLQIHNNTTLRR